MVLVEDYEDETYSECRKCLPKIGEIIETEEGRGKVVSVDILNKKYSVEISGIGVREEEVCGNH